MTAAFCILGDLLQKQPPERLLSLEMKNQIEMSFSAVKITIVSNLSWKSTLHARHLINDCQNLQHLIMRKPDTSWPPTSASTCPNGPCACYTYSTCIIRAYSYDMWSL